MEGHFLIGNNHRGPKAVNPMQRQKLSSRKRTGHPSSEDSYNIHHHVLDFFSNAFCHRYLKAWFPDATTDNNHVFLCSQVSAAQGSSIFNHSHLFVFKQPKASAFPYP